MLKVRYIRTAVERKGRGRAGQVDLREGFQLGIGLNELTHSGGENTEAWHNSNLVNRAGREMGRD